MGTQPNEDHDLLKRRLARLERRITQATLLCNSLPHLSPARAIADNQLASIIAMHRALIARDPGLFREQAASP